MNPWLPQADPPIAERFPLPSLEETCSTHHPAMRKLLMWIGPSLAASGLHAWCRVRQRLRGGVAWSTATRDAASSVRPPSVDSPQRLASIVPLLPVLQHLKMSASLLSNNQAIGSPGSLFKVAVRFPIGARSDPRSSRCAGPSDDRRDR